MVSVWPQWWRAVGGPPDKIWDLVPFVWPIRSRVFTTSSALVRCWNLFRGPQCRFHEIEISVMYSYIPLGLNQLLNVGVDQWFQICIMDTRQWVYVLIKGLFCKLVHFFISLNATVFWYVCPCYSITRAGSWYGKSKGSQCLHPQLPANKTLSQSTLLHRDELGPCVGNSSVPKWWL